LLLAINPYPILSFLAIMPQVVCCCSRCAQFTFLKNGDKYSGKRVSHTTRSEHEKADLLRRLKADTKTAGKSSGENGTGIPRAAKTAGESSGEKGKGKPAGKNAGLSGRDDTSFGMSIRYHLWLPEFIYLS
jgi:hypothetical protein